MPLNLFSMNTGGSVIPSGTSKIFPSFDFMSLSKSQSNYWGWIVDTDEGVIQQLDILSGVSDSSIVKALNNVQQVISAQPNEDEAQVVADEKEEEKQEVEEAEATAPQSKPVVEVPPAEPQIVEQKAPESQDVVQSPEETMVEETDVPINEPVAEDKPAENVIVEATNEPQPAEIQQTTAVEDVAIDDGDAKIDKMEVDKPHKDDEGDVIMEDLESVASEELEKMHFSGKTPPPEDEEKQEILLDKTPKDPMTKMKASLQSSNLAFEEVGQEETEFTSTDMKQLLEKHKKEIDGHHKKIQQTMDELDLETDQQIATQKKKMTGEVEIDKQIAQMSNPPTPTNEPQTKKQKLTQVVEEKAFEPTIKTTAPKGSVEQLNATMTADEMIKTIWHDEKVSQKIQQQLNEPAFRQKITDETAKIKSTVKVAGSKLPSVQEILQLGDNLRQGKGLSDKTWLAIKFSYDNHKQGDDVYQPIGQGEMSSLRSSATSSRQALEQAKEFLNAVVQNPTNIDAHLKLYHELIRGLTKWKAIFLGSMGRIYAKSQGHWDYNTKKFVSSNQSPQSALQKHIQQGTMDKSHTQRANDYVRPYLNQVKALTGELSAINTNNLWLEDSKQGLRGTYKQMLDVAKNIQIHMPKIIFKMQGFMQTLENERQKGSILFADFRDANQVKGLLDKNPKLEFVETVKASKGQAKINAELLDIKQGKSILSLLKKAKKGGN